MRVDLPIPASFRSWLYAGLLPLASLHFAGCSTVPVSAPVTSPPAVNAASEPASAPVRAEIIHHARDMIGAPYRFGGTTPRGFDCSGLVFYSYRKAGITVPRTTREQYQFAQPVPEDQLRPGDLLFFRLSKSGVSHVAIYAGNGEFIHAPSTGKRVTRTSLNDPFWRPRLVRTGRLTAPEDTTADLAARVSERDSRLPAQETE